MVKVKNVRPGIVIIADAGLKLGPGEVADISSLTPQIKKAVDDGLLARVDTDLESSQAVKEPAKVHEQTTAKSESREVADISSLTPQAEKVIEDGPLVRIHSEPEQAKGIAKGDELFLSDGKLPDAQIPAEQKPRLSQPVKSESGVKHGAG